MEVDGVSFRLPTTTEMEHNAECDKHPKKRNLMNHLSQIICCLKGFKGGIKSKTKKE